MNYFFPVLLGTIWAVAAWGQALGQFEASGDVGKTLLAGTAAFDPATGAYRVTGAGANMWLAEDAFHFVWRQVSGDVTLTADVQFVGGGKNAHRKAVLILRDGLGADAAYADVALHGDGLTSLQYRAKAGTGTEEVRSSLSGPVRIRIERRGDRVMLFAGKPGETLQGAGPVTVPLKGPVYAGLGVCSHEPDVLETAIFTNVKLESGRSDQAWRPRITGVAHMALFVHDINKARSFYKDFLGFAEPFNLLNGDGTLSLTFFKINDRQYLELFPEREAGSDRLNHFSVETDDAEGMRRYLASRGVKVPEKVGRGRTGNSNFNVKDPDGHTLEIVQYEPDSWTSREKDKFLPPTRVSDWMMHVGFLVGALGPAKDFYGNILGFQETWRGSRDGKTLNWVNMKVPDGDDYVEFMLHDQLPPPGQRGTANHICLSVPDLDKSLAELSTRPGYDRPMEIRTGINRKRQLNLYDPDGTRTELMEPRTVDGKRVPSSTAPPPK
jgi:catechol 2,3-dioxygenase-like lactoylglutathione lyase family enzyme